MASLRSPFAGSLRVGLCHQAGIKGQGVRIGVLDSGTHPSPFFSEHGYRVEGDEDVLWGHGTSMAAVILTVAPDSVVVGIRLDPRCPSAAFAKAAEAALDFVVCAWGTNASFDTDLLRAFEGRVLAAADAAHSGQLPAASPHAVPVSTATRWPAGPFVGLGSSSFEGLSAQIAVAAGVSALAISNGAPVRTLLPAVVAAQVADARTFVQPFGVIP